MISKINLHLMLIIKLKEQFILLKKMRYVFNELFCIILFLILCSTNIIAQNEGINKTKEIAPGIYHEQIINKKDRLVINILKIDLKNKSYIIDAVKADNLLHSKATTSMVSARLDIEGFDVIAAINADFWEPDGEIVNNMISKGAFVKAISGYTDIRSNHIFSQFALTKNNKPLIEKFSLNGKLILRNKNVYKINRINSKTDSSSITLYNHYEGNETPQKHIGWNMSETYLQPSGSLGDTLLFVIKGKWNNNGETKIPPSGYVLSASNNIGTILEQKIPENDNVKILLNMNPNLGKIYALTGGLPLIVENGKNLPELSDTLFGLKKSFTVTQHPRTGLGFSKDSTYLYFFTVDGRQESSSGMSLKEFAELMISHGVYQGLNLDGGGSTTMVIHGKVVNHPSDRTGERPVGSCIVILKKN